MVMPKYFLAAMLFAALLASGLFAKQPADRTAQPGGAPSTAAPGAKPAPSMQPEPTTVPGRPDIPNAEVAQKLRNVAPLPFGAPADKLPTAELKAPTGFKVELY